MHTYEYMDINGHAYMDVNSHMAEYEYKPYIQTNDNEYEY